MSDGARLCPVCGTRNPATNTYCNVCGANLAAQPVPATPPAAATATVTCPNCGFVNEGPGAFCGECGMRLPAPAATYAPPPAYPPASNWSSTPPPTVPPGGYYPSPYGAAPFREPITGYATFWRRLAAILLDIAILIIPAIIAAVILILAFGEDASNVILWFVVSCYFWIMNGYGGTLGKRILGIRVIDADGNVPGLSKGFVRAVIPSWLGVFSAVTGGGAAGLVLLISLFQLFDALWMIWDGNKQTLHDKMAGTRVIKT